MDIEGVIISLFEGVATVDFNFILKFVVAAFIIFWLTVIFWTVKDAKVRNGNFWFILLAVFLLMVFNVLGLLVYLLIRPNTTKEEEYWSDLERKYLLYETDGLIECPKCNNLLFPDYIACPHCGYNVKHECSKCGVFIKNEWKFCPYCGTKQDLRSANTNDKQVSKPSNNIPSSQVDNDNVVLNEDKRDSIKNNKSSNTLGKTPQKKIDFKGKFRDFANIFKLNFRKTNRKTDPDAINKDKGKFKQIKKKNKSEKHKKRSKRHKNKKRK